MKKNFFQNRHSGYATLITLLFVGAIGLAIAVSLLLLGVDALKISFVTEQSNQAKSLAYACAEKALDNLRKDFNYVGNEELSLGQGTCQILAISGSDSFRTIRVLGKSGNVIRKIKIEINQLEPSLNVAFWKEVADF